LRRSLSFSVNGELSLFNSGTFMSMAGVERSSILPLVALLLVQRVVALGPGVDGKLSLFGSASFITTAGVERSTILVSSLLRSMLVTASPHSIKNTYVFRVSAAGVFCVVAEGPFSSSSDSVSD
jgi:hypothetical protein